MAVSKKNRRIPITLPLSMINDLKKRALAEDRTMSNLVKKLLRERI